MALVVEESSTIYSPPPQQTQPPQCHTPATYESSFTSTPKLPLQSKPPTPSSSFSKIPQSMTRKKERSISPASSIFSLEENTMRKRVHKHLDEVTLRTGISSATTSNSTTTQTIDSSRSFTPFQVPAVSFHSKPVNNINASSSTRQTLVQNQKEEDVVNTDVVDTSSSTSPSSTAKTPALDSNLDTQSLTETPKIDNKNPAYTPNTQIHNTNNHNHNKHIQFSSTTSVLSLNSTSVQSLNSNNSFASSKCSQHTVTIPQLVEAQRLATEWKERANHWNKLSDFTPNSNTTSAQGDDDTQLQPQNSKSYAIPNNIQSCSDCEALQDPNTDSSMPSQLPPPPPPPLPFSTNTKPTTQTLPLPSTSYPLSPVPSFEETDEEMETDCTVSTVCTDPSHVNLDEDPCLAHLGEARMVANLWLDRAAHLQQQIKFSEKDHGEVDEHLSLDMDTDLDNDTDLENEETIEVGIVTPDHHHHHHGKVQNDIQVINIDLQATNIDANGDVANHKEEKMEEEEKDIQVLNEEESIQKSQVEEKNEDIVPSSFIMEEGEEEDFAFAMPSNYNTSQPSRSFFTQEPEMKEYKSVQDSSESMEERPLRVEVDEQGQSSSMLPSLPLPIVTPPSLPPRHPNSTSSQPTSLKSLPQDTPPNNVKEEPTLFTPTPIPTKTTNQARANKQPKSTGSTIRDPSPDCISAINTSNFDDRKTEVSTASAKTVPVSNYQPLWTATEIVFSFSLLTGSNDLPPSGNYNNLGLDREDDKLDYDLDTLTSSSTSRHESLRSRSKLLHKLMSSMSRIVTRTVLFNARKHKVLSPVGNIPFVVSVMKDESYLPPSNRKGITRCIIRAAIPLFCKTEDSESHAFAEYIIRVSLSNAIVNGEIKP